MRYALLPCRAVWIDINLLTLIEIETRSRYHMIYDSLAELVRLAKQKAETDNIPFFRNTLYHFLRQHKQIESVDMHYVKNGACRLTLLTSDKITAYLDLTILETGIVDKVTYLISPHVGEERIAHSVFSS